MKFLSALSFLALATLHVVDGDDSESSLDTGGSSFPLGNMRPEGSHALSAQDAAEMGLAASGSYMLVSEFFYGGVKLLDVTTGDVMNVVPSAGYLERGGIGLFYVDGHILSASGGPALGLPFEVYVFDAQTGDLVTTCVTEEEEGFMNDFEVIGDTAYVTDTTHNRLWKFDIPSAIAGNCELQFQELDAEVFLGDDQAGFRSNGIVSFGDGFLIALYQTGGVYYIDPNNGITEEVIPLGDLVLADGLELITEDDGSMTLYITEGGDKGPVSVYQVQAGDPAPTVTRLGTLQTGLYDTPATSAVLGDTIYTTNARAGTIPFLAPGENNTATFGEQFQVIGMNRMVWEDGSDPPESSPDAAGPVEESDSQD